MFHSEFERQIADLIKLQKQVMETASELFPVGAVVQQKNTDNQGLVHGVDVAYGVNVQVSFENGNICGKGALTLDLVPEERWHPWIKRLKSSKF